MRKTIISICILFSDRTRGRFFETIEEINDVNQDHRLSTSEMKNAVSRMNSYLGILGHYDTYNVRARGLECLDNRFTARVRKRKGLKSLAIK